MNTDARMGDNNAREFQFLACSGATSPQILANQVPQIQDGVQVITVTAGGNDAGFANVLKKCIYPVFGKSNLLCDQALSEVDAVIRSPEFRENIKSLIAGALAKLGTDGRLYYVGYAPFFDAESTQCNEVSWSVADLDRLVGGGSAKLSTSIRSQINVLVSRTNAILDELIQASGDNVVFVDYSGWVSQVGGRFCEEGVKEPYANSPDLFFYEWGTVDPWQETVDGRISARSPEQLITPSNSTFGGQILSEIDDAQTTDPELKIRDIFSEDTSETKVMLPDDPAKRETILMESIKRVFHPTLFGHTLIANLVFYHMGAQRAGMLQKPVTPMLGKLLPSTCSVPDDQPGSIIAQVVDCKSAGDVPRDAWFDIDTGHQARDNFCKVVASKASHNIADAHGEYDSMTVSEDFPYVSSQPMATWIGMWVQNAGCQRPTLYPSEEVCRVMLDAIMDQCKLRSHLHWY